MGSTKSKDRSSPCENKGLKEKVRFLEREIGEIMRIRENENQAHEHEMVVYAFKEAEWKRERKMLREEAKKLRKTVEAREERVREMKEGVPGEKMEKELEYWELLGTTSYMVEQMMEERARRDEAVEKWKRLYLAIKIELDDLIQRTHQGERWRWKAEEEEPLRQELKAKEETIALLQARLASVEKEGARRDREVDILRQSLRIVTHKKKQPTTVAKNLGRKLHL
ncbi:uncharacterized protein LOC127799287 [Diospyros lotus]|uniref:uncharacterized protein LOC127799287 n=1 Tax=Diospyros lotus TaxID=55363 RepID=UPI00224EFDE2|nr:uncharacterized protein LOC127799287 [Diospyros lotus]XP_052189159.1 uncharacterized protein LOC127799287 [Diospyros lotus]